jgi:hypothetical protein
MPRERGVNTSIERQRLPTSASTADGKLKPHRSAPSPPNAGAFSRVAQRCGRLRRCRSTTLGGTGPDGRYKSLSLLVSTLRVSRSCM